MKTTFLLSVFLLCNVLFSFGQWTYNNLSQPRNWMGAVAYGNKAYFAGGETDLGDASIVEIYDVVKGKWDTPIHLSVARSGPSAVACDSMVFFAGGYESASHTARSTVDIWDIPTQRWYVEQLSIPRFAISAVSKGHKVLFAGGVLWDLTGYNRVDIYDTQTGTWSTASLSIARGSMASAVVGDLAIFAGGILPGGGVTNRVDIYNFATNTWSTASLSQARHMAVATTIGNKVLIAGGMTANLGVPSDRVDIYDALTNTWTTASLFIPRGILGAATLDDKAYFVGGGKFGNEAVVYDFTDVIDIYDEATNTWSMDFLSEPVGTHSVLAIGNQLLVAGGKTTGDLRVNKMEILPVGIKLQHKDGAFFKVYPNPSSETISIEFPGSGQNLDGIAHIYGIDGREVMCQNAAGLKSEIDITNLTPGLYFIKLISNNKIGAGKFVKN
jgi:hypothetical protein